MGAEVDRAKYKALRRVLKFMLSLPAFEKDPRLFAGHCFAVYRCAGSVLRGVIPVKYLHVPQQVKMSEHLRRF